MSHQILQKTYKCNTCQADIKLQRKDDNSGWNRYNLDGTPHADQQQKRKHQQLQQQHQHSQPTITSSASTGAAQTAPPAAPTTTSSSLERKLDDLIAEVQALRMELLQQQQRR